MADYWKSQARKYCDFCKCWISDNRASVDFHESGKKHKENVGRRLKEIHKNSAKQAKQQKKFENDLEKMEKAAMEAYMKDVANNTRDITSDSIIQQKWSSEQANTESVNPNTIPGASPNAHPRYNQSISYASYGAADIDPLDPFAKQKLARLEAQNKAKSNKQAKKEKDKLEKIKKESENLEVEARRNRLTQRKVWYEARSQGHSYYWNIETNETMWEPPAVGYMSLNEQAAEAEEQALQEQMFEQIAKEQEKERAVTFEEQRANAERQKLKEFRKRFHENKFPEMREENEETVSYRRDYSVPDKLQPYGTWQVIETPKTDFQLPKEDVPIVTVSLNDEKPTSKKVFKEKTITAISIGDSDDESSVILFKKRKFGNRNVRKRMEND